MGLHKIMCDLQDQANKKFGLEGKDKAPRSVVNIAFFGGTKIIPADDVEIAHTRLMPNPKSCFESNICIDENLELKIKLANYHILQGLQFVRSKYFDALLSNKRGKHAIDYNKIDTSEKDGIWPCINMHPLLIAGLQYESGEILDFQQESIIGNASTEQENGKPVIKIQETVNGVMRRTFKWLPRYYLK